MFTQKKGVRVLPVLLLVAALMMISIGCSSESSSTDNQNAESNEEAVSEESESQGGPQQGGEITIAYGADVSNLDPIKGTKGEDHALLWPVYDTLVKFSSDLEPEPGLAESWDRPDDETIVLHLREGVTFHDGTPFDAEAVKFNLERVNSEDSQISDLSNIESVEVVDEHTVELHLSQPDSSIILALTDRGGMMVSPTAVEKHGEDFSQHPVGAGPFKMAEHAPNDEIVYEAYNDYWEEKKPYLDKMTAQIIPEENSRINALQSGQVDFVPGVQPQQAETLEQNSNINVTNQISLYSLRFFINTDLEPFDNKAVRLAVLHGINREELVEATYYGQGEPAYQPFPKNYWAHDDSVKIKYDPEKSKELLEEQGLEDVSFTLLTGPDASASKVANAVKGQLEEVGITLDIEQLEPNAAVQKFLIDKDATALFGNWTGRADPQTTITGLYSKDSFYNAGGSSTSELESLISEAATTYDQEERATLYGDISEEAVVQQGFGMPLFFPMIIDAMDQKVNGYQTNLLGKPIFSNIWIEQE